GGIGHLGLGFFTRGAQRRRVLALHARNLAAMLIGLSLEVLFVLGGLRGQLALSPILGGSELGLALFLGRIHFGYPALLGLRELFLLVFARIGQRTLTFGVAIR